MPSWLKPVLVQVGEALFVGVGAAFAVKQAGGDTLSALVAGLSAVLAKVAPSQMLGKKS